MKAPDVYAYVARKKSQKIFCLQRGYGRKVSDRDRVVQSYKRKEKSRTNYNSARDGKTMETDPKGPYSQNRKPWGGSCSCR